MMTSRRQRPLWNFAFGEKFRNFMELYNGYDGTDNCGINMCKNFDAFSLTKALKNGSSVCVNWWDVKPYSSQLREAVAVFYVQRF